MICNNIKFLALYCVLSSIPDIADAAVLMDSLAMCNYADRLAEGRGVKKNVQEAAYYYKQAADRGHLEAMYCSGVLFEKDSRYQEAIAYYEKAAAQWHIEAEFRLGELLEKDSRHKEALTYYERAATQGHAEARFRLRVLS
jgi:TPR repeat protein